MEPNRPFRSISLEEAGIPAASVLQFLERLAERQVCLHSVQLLRYGQLAAEGYYAPFTAQSPHRMYSVTKSYTSVAIGFLADEGKLKLSDHIVDYFPEKLPAEGVHPWIAATTIRDMLLMASPHERTTYRRVDDDDWVRTFFTYPPSHHPGTIFSYDTSASTVLCALVEKLTGQTLVEYLTPRLFEPLECSSGIYCTQIPLGGSWGGSGLVCTPRDFAKFAQTCMDDGRWEGRQIIPAWYIREATAKQIDNSITNPALESQQGYGYQFWRCCHNGFACRGMGSQLAICLPDRDFILVTTADTQLQPNGEYEIFDALWETIYPALSDTPLAADPDAAALQAKLADLKVQTAPGLLHTPQHPAVIPGLCYQMGANDMGLTELSFTFEETGGCMKYSNARGIHTLRFGYGVQLPQTFDGGYPCIASAAWADSHTLRIYAYMIGDHLATIHMSVCFEPGAVTILMKRAAELFLNDYEGFASGSAE